MLVCYKLCRCSCTVLLTVIFVAFSSHVRANDVFVGKFASLPMKFLSGAGEANFLEIHIVPSGDKYIVTEFAKGEFKRDYLAKRCDPKQNLMVSLFARGEVYALCGAEAGFAKFVYSQNGINVHDPIIQNLKDKNGESLVEESYFQEQYYIPAFFAFRRVDSFKYAPNDPIKLLNNQ